jgi:hypothetical protein
MLGELEQQRQIAEKLRAQLQQRTVAASRQHEALQHEVRSGPFALAYHLPQHLITCACASVTRLRQAAAAKLRRFLARPRAPASPGAGEALAAGVQPGGGGGGEGSGAAGCGGAAAGGAGGPGPCFGQGACGPRRGAGGAAAGAVGGAPCARGAQPPAGAAGCGGAAAAADVARGRRPCGRGGAAGGRRRRAALRGARGAGPQPGLSAAQGDHRALCEAAAVDAGPGPLRMPAPLALRAVGACPTGGGAGVVALRAA